jgi:hypothetical protein
MIRKAIMLMLTVVATSTGALWVISARCPVSTASYPLEYGVAHDLYGVTPTVNRLNLVAGKVWVRLAFLVDGETSVPTFEMDLGGFRVRIERLAPSTRWHRGSGVVYLRAETPEEQTEIESLLAKNLVRIEVLRLPLWAPFLLFSAYPTIALIRGPLRRWHRRRRGLCLKCGYNLTANVSGICPECGREVEG